MLISFRLRASRKREEEINRRNIGKPRKLFSSSSLCSLLSLFSAKTCRLLCYFLLSLTHTHTHILLLTFFFFLFLSFSSSSSSIFTVSRFVCQSDLYDMSLTLDVNVEIYPMDVSERFKMLLTKDVNLGTATDKNGNVWEVSRR